MILPSTYEALAAIAKFQYLPHGIPYRLKNKVHSTLKQGSIIISSKFL